MARITGILFFYGSLILALASVWAAIVGLKFKDVIPPETITHEIGFNYTSQFPRKLPWWSGLQISFDGMNDPAASNAMLFENGEPLPSAHAVHDDIRQLGNGRFSHWNSDLFFSSSDGTDPRANGRSYTVLSTAYLRSSWVVIGVLPLILAISARAIRQLRRFVPFEIIIRPYIIPLFIAVIGMSPLVFYGINQTLVLEPSKVLSGIGNSFVYQIPAITGSRIGSLFATVSDTAEHPNKSPTRVFENDREFMANHVQHTDIQSLGSGRFSHWHETLVFSSSDNSNPRDNGRTYTVKLRYVLDIRVFQLAAIGLFLLIMPALVGRGLWKVSAAAGIIAILAFYALEISAGVVVWLLVAILAALAIYVFGLVTSVLFPRSSSERIMNANAHLALAGLAFFCSVALCELTLLGYDKLGKYGVKLPNLQQLLFEDAAAVQKPVKWSANSQTELAPTSAHDIQIVHEIMSTIDPAAVQVKQSRRGMLALPPEWMRRTVNIDGAPNSFFWHGALHLLSNEHFRRSSEFPDKNEEIFRIIVIGDSFTYGQGVAEEFTYPSVLERELKKRYRVEVLNLGACGYQSEDELAVVKSYVPRLRPDLVLYGSCLNDFLPSGVGQGVDYTLPLPALIRNRTRVGQILDRAASAIAVRLGWSKDFYQQVFDGIHEYRERYARDMKEMNAFVQLNQLPAVISMVLNQDPVIGDPGHHLALIAEQAFEAAGMRVIRTAPIFAALSGQSFRVSPWEGHPDEEMHYLFGMLFAREVEATGLLQNYRKSDS